MTPLQIAVHRVNSQQAALSAAKSDAAHPDESFSHPERGKGLPKEPPRCCGKRLRFGEEPSLSHIVSSGLVVTDKAKALPRTRLPTAGLSADMAGLKETGISLPRGGREDNGVCLNSNHRLRERTEEFKAN